MPHLSPRDRALVALGAAMGSNCVPCVEHHLPRGRTAGLSDSQISETIRLADQIRQVPARRVLEVALHVAEHVRSDATPGKTAEAVQTADAGDPCCP
jgi:4-carboxymuconolactone decarboxylase